MKRILYIVIILSLLLSGCSNKNADQAETAAFETPAETAAQPDETVSPQPTNAVKTIEFVENEFENVSLDNDIIAVDLPAAFEQTDIKIGQIYSSQGYANTGGNYYTFHVLRFYQPEDVSTSISRLLEFDESMETYKYGYDIEYKNIMRNMPFGDAIGHISKITIGDTEKYTATLYAQDTYYKFILSSTGDLSAELMAVRILTSIQIDGENAQKQSDQFALNTDEQTYHSTKLEGASIAMPEGWYPGESMYFSLENSILALMTQAMEGTATVRYYPKDEYSEIADYNAFCDYMKQDLITRGFLGKNQVDQVETFNPGEEGEFYMYPLDIVLIHYIYEYDDAFFCVELVYTGTDIDTTGELMEIGESFIR